MMGRTQRLLGVVAVLVLAAACSRTSADVVDASPHRGVMEGVVTDASGAPLAGAFVKLHDPDRRLTFMVVSQDGGRYSARKLPAGNYRVQAVGGDVESAWSAPVTVAGDGAAKFDVALSTRRAPLLPAAWPRRVAEHEASLDDLPAGPEKNTITAKCATCHEATRIVTSRQSREAWQTTLQSMRDFMQEARMPLLSKQEEGALLEYLTANLPPMAAPDPNSRFPRALMQGDQRNYRVVQYDLTNRGAETHDVAVDPRGVGWANQRIGGKISRFDPVTYEYKEIGPPLYTAKRARPGNLQIGSDGMMWLADPFETRWLRYEIEADRWTDFKFPADRIRGPVQGNTAAIHPDGSIWMAGPGSARRLDPKTGQFQAFDTPIWKRTQRNPGGYGMTVDGAGNVWMAMNLVDKMARFDGKTGEATEFDIPVAGTSYPRRMDTDWNGDVWVGLWGAGKLLRIDHKTNAMTVIDPPVPYNGAYMISADPQNKVLWVTLHTVDMIGRYTPDTGEWLLLPLPQAETDVRRIEVDLNNPNRIWWSTTANDARIGYVELLN